MFVSEHAAVLAPTQSPLPRRVKHLVPEVWHIVCLGGLHGGRKKGGRQHGPCQVQRGGAARRGASPQAPHMSCIGAHVAREVHPHLDPGARKRGRIGGAALVGVGCAAEGGPPHLAHQDGFVPAPAGGQGGFVGPHCGAGWWGRIVGSDGGAALWGRMVGPHCEVGWWGRIVRSDGGAALWGRMAGPHCGAGWWGRMVGCRLCGRAGCGCRR